MLERNSDGDTRQTGEGRVQPPGSCASVRNMSEASTSKLKATFVSGAMAGMVSRTATAPLDRLKTLAQAGCSRPASSADVCHLRLEPSTRRSDHLLLTPSGLKSAQVAGGMRLLYREGGLVALYQGNSANVLKAMPEVRPDPPTAIHIRLRRHL